MEQQFEGKVESTEVVFFKVRQVRAHWYADENDLVSCKRKGWPQIENSGGCGLCEKHGQFIP